MTIDSKRVTCIAALAAAVACGAGNSPGTDTLPVLGSDAGPDDGAALDATGGDAAAVDAQAHDAAALAQVPGFGSSLASGDPVNATPPVLAALGDGIVLAGASADPKVVGVADFGDGGKLSEAFAARLDHTGKALWRVALAPAGLPDGIVVGPDGNIVVAAPYLPQLTTVSTGFVGTDIYLAKLGPDGAKVYEKDVPLPGIVGSADDIGVNGLAVDSTGALLVVGQIVHGDTGIESAFLGKFDKDGNVLWTKEFAGDGPGQEVVGYAVAVAADDEIVVTGDFQGGLDFGGGALASTTDGGFQIAGFVARYTSAGAHVSSVSFGDVGASRGNALVAVGSDVLLAGQVAGGATLGGKRIQGDSSMDSPFIARLDRTGLAAWAVPIAGTNPGSAGRAFAVDPDGRAYLAGQLGGSLLVVDTQTVDGMAIGTISATANDAGAGIAGWGAALDSTGSLWVGGTFDTQATLGSVILNGTAEGVFVARIDP